MLARGLALRSTLSVRNEQRKQGKFVVKRFTGNKTVVESASKVPGVKSAIPEVDEALGRQKSDLDDFFQEKAPQNASEFVVSKLDTIINW
jgi:hypothetical protein